MVATNSRRILIAWVPAPGYQNVLQSQSTAMGFSVSEVVWMVALSSALGSAVQVKQFSSNRTVAGM